MNKSKVFVLEKELFISSYGATTILNLVDYMVYNYKDVQTHQRVKALAI